MNKLNELANEIHEALYDHRESCGLDLTDSRVVDGKIVVNLVGDNSYKIIIKSGVVAIYKNSDLIDVYFDCDHVHTDRPEITVEFLLKISDIKSTTEYQAD